MLQNPPNLTNSTVFWAGMTWKMAMKFWTQLWAREWTEYWPLPICHMKKTPTRNHVKLNHLKFQELYLEMNRISSVNVTLCQDGVEPIPTLNLNLYFNLIVSLIIKLISFKPVIIWCLLFYYNLKVVSFSQLFHATFWSATVCIRVIRYVMAVISTIKQHFYGTKRYFWSFFLFHRLHYSSWTRTFF